MKLKNKMIALLIILVILFSNCMFLSKVYAVDVDKMKNAAVIETETKITLTFEKDTENKEKWYKFVAPEEGYYEIELSNSNKEYETELLVSTKDMNSTFSWARQIWPVLTTYVYCEKDDICTVGVEVKEDVTEDYTLDLVVRKHIHTYGDPVIKKAHYSEGGKKKSDGYIRHTCTKCYYSYDDVIPTVKSITLNKSKYVYDGKIHFPTAIIKDRTGKVIDPSNFDYEYSAASGNKSVRRHCVSILSESSDFYDVYAAEFFTIVPKGTSIKKLTKKRKAITVKWKAQKTQTSGYQIRYSLRKDMSKAKKVTIKSNRTTIKTIKKLKKKKKYYVQIRTYKNVPNGPKYDRYYSSWSKIKTVKTK